MTITSQLVRKDCARHGPASLNNGIACIHCTNEGIAESSAAIETLPRLMRRCPNPRGRPKAPPLLGQPLSERERQIVALLGAGKRLRHVAAHLGLDKSTVAHFSGRARDKLGLHSTRHLAAYATEHGFTA